MGVLDGKTAIVTGAAVGIGDAIAMAFASEGAQLLLAELDADRLDAAAERHRQPGARAAAATVDLTDRNRPRTRSSSA
jgi:NADP-dependent 3-hydroxy acid dehydrogenase YdfG